MIGVAQVQTQLSSGPLPPPESLEKYEQVLPGLAERIVVMAETQARHRQLQESKVVDSGVAATPRGQWMAFVLGLVAIIGGCIVAVMGQSSAGIAAIVSAMGGLATVFIFGRWSQMRERERAREPQASKQV